MKRLMSVLLCVLLIISMVITVYAATSVPEPVMKATDSVVRILAEYSDGYATGSGFVIKSDKEETLIATNYHVVEGNPYSISVWISAEETMSASIVAYTDQKDICILKLTYPVPLKALVFAKNGAKQGEAVYAVGFPGAADYLSDSEAHTSADATITDGIVSAVREATVSSYGTPAKILQINAAINSGNSGGPLFNADGKVVGINTYGISDAQGIFGAIDVSELKAFMADNAVSPKNADGGLWWIILVGGVIAVVVVLIVVLRKKKMRKPAKVRVKNIPLRDYMAAYPDGIGMTDAVAMLLPVALQLRDLHNEGKAHLQVSPNTVSVGTNGAILAEPTASEADRYTSGFAAPEIYKGMSSGNLSDIYSFCALLSYVATGKQPVNSLSRADAEFEVIDSEQVDDTFRKIIEKGMELEAENRFDAVQNLIIRLSAYNLQPFEKRVETKIQNAPIAKTKKKRKVSLGVIVIAVSLIVVLALAGTYAGCYVCAKMSAQGGDFQKADALLFVDMLTKVHDEKLVAYIDAGQMMLDRKYDEAKTSFVALSGYLDADEMAKEIDYRHAAQLADANQFEEAKAIYAELGEYKDAQDKVLETEFRKGAYILYELNDYQKAENIFKQLVQRGYTAAEEMQKETQYLWANALIKEKSYIIAYKKLERIQDYADTKNLLEALTEIIYYYGIEKYTEEDFTTARNMFTFVSPYADSEMYIKLIEERTSFEWLWSQRQ